MQGGAPEHLVEAGRVGRDLLRVELRRKAPEQRLKGRLGGRAEDGRGVVMLDELGDGTDAGGKVVTREGLRLVEDDDAVGDVVELAAAAAAVGVERLEELHRRRHHDGGVPVFAGQHLAYWAGVRSSCSTVLYSALEKSARTFSAPSRPEKTAAVWSMMDI